ncbi:MAG: hypothetical protein ACI915_003148 [Gammaproteobacteria bacterium]|jgi:hypothetical protein
MARQSSSTLLSALFSLLVLASATLPASAANQAGEVVLARGIATSQAVGSRTRILGIGSPLFVGDVISTGPRSIALLRLGDGSRLTLRPQTKFQVEEFNIEEGDERAVYRLFQGGLRAVTGFLSKRNKNAVRLRTSVATIGIRGTEFDARICGADCTLDAKARAVPSGRAGFVKGSVAAQSGSGGRARALRAGAPIYSGETVTTSTGSFAVLTFKDKSRVTLMPKTEFRIEQLVFDEAKPEAGRGIFALVRGGLRAVSGSIGKYGNRRAYQMRTAVATIGIRGTEYEMFLEEMDLYMNVVDGGVFADNGPLITPAEGILMFGAPGIEPVSMASFPVPMQIPPEANIPVLDIPPVPTSVNPPQGLIVACYVGNCSMTTDQNTVELEQGEAGFVGTNGGPAEQLPEIPPFMPEDTALGIIESGSSTNFLDDTLDAGGSECFVQ